MDIRPFNIKEELGILNGWMSSRGLYSVCENTLPTLGFMAYEKQIPIACLFLRKCEGNFCMGDIIITNPELSGGLRNLALDMLFEEGKRVAASHDFISILAYSMDDTTLMRLEKHGFIQSPFTFFTLNVRESLS